MTMIELATKQKEKILKDIKKLEPKFNALKKELDKVNGVIKLLVPQWTGEKEDRMEPVEPPRPDEPSVADKIRAFCKNKPDGLNHDELRKFAQMAYPNTHEAFCKQMHNALLFLCNREELTKFGTGNLSIYKPTDKLK